MSPCGVSLLVFVAAQVVFPAAAAAQGPDLLRSGEVRVRAESYEQTSPGRVEARGLVDLQVADIRIQADRADVIEERQLDGGARQRVVAEGNVVLIRGEERLSGDRLELDDSGKGTLSNAVGYLEPGLFVTARMIERLDADSYRVVGGTFSSCSQANPRWSFSASRASVDVDDKITGVNAVFKVKGVPAFYTPFVYYPIRKDGRSTGFLLPSVGYSEARGYNLKAGFFWAMGRSADQTFWLDSYTKAGNGLGHELRWVGRASSRWTLRSRLFDAKGSGGTDYMLDGSGLQQLPGKLRAEASVRLASSTAFAQQQEGESARGTRANDWSLRLERDFGLVVLDAYGDATDERAGLSSGKLKGRLPGLHLRRFPRQIGWGGLVVGLEATAERIRYGTPNRLDAWTRYDFAPTLSRPLHVSFLDVNPSLGYRYLRYGSRLLLDEKGKPVSDEHGELERDEAPLGRSFFETAIETRGPTFARVFDTPGFGYSERFKHTIGPEVTWAYTVPVADFAGIPPDGKPDRLVATSRIDYALVQRFYAKRIGSRGAATAYEFASWRLQQAWSARTARSLGEDASPAGLGRLDSRLTLRPTPQYAFEYELEYDVGHRQIQHMSASASAMRSGLFLEASWQRNLNGADAVSNLPTAGEESHDRSQTLGLTTALELFARRLTVEGKIDYDVAQQKLWQVRGLVRYSTQCCGFTVERNWRSSDTGPADAQWRFSIELANVGSIGGSPPAGRDGGFLGLGVF